MAKLYILFQLITFAHVFYLFQVLSTVQQTRFSWVLIMRKTAPCCDSFLQKFGTSMQNSLSFTLETSVQPIQ